MADRFYTPDPLGPGEYELVGAEAHHLVAVRRFAPGDHVLLFNGDGNEYPSEVVSAGKRSVFLNVLRVETPDRELGFPLVVAAAIPKGDRADFLIEKLTEFGVTCFVPLVTSRSVVQPKESAVEKYRRGVIEASKQCGRNTLMAVEHPQRWETFLRREDLPPERWVLHTDAIAAPAAGLQPDRKPVIVAVGPEGGFTSDEVELAVAAGWRAVSLGPRTLRVETAALAFAARLQ